MIFTTTGTYLDRILANTVDEIRQRMESSSLDSLTKLASERPAAASLAAALTATDEVSVIAEFKRASPSKGRIAGDVTPADIVPEYLAGGCAAISVLTDQEFFQGSLGDLRDTRELAGAGSGRKPVLRKDFIVSDYQIIEARAHGADAVLLIVAALTDDQLHDLHAAAAENSMEALVEVHDEGELERALSINPRIIGINNRDLRTFDVDLGTTERLAPQVPDGIAIVGESGVGGREDAVRLGATGVDAVLVGESLMRRSDRAAAVRELLGQ